MQLWFLKSFSKVISYDIPNVSLVVRGAGLEPASLAAKDPKSFVFANFTSRAIEKLAIDHLPGGCFNTGCRFFGSNRPISASDGTSPGCGLISSRNRIP